MATQPKVLQQSIVGVSNWAPINLHAFRFGVGLLVTWQPSNQGGASAVNIDVLVTGNKQTDNPFPAQFNKHDTLQNLTGAGVLAGWNSSLAYPCSGMAVRINSISFGGLVTLAIVQVTD